MTLKNLRARIRQYLETCVPLGIDRLKKSFDSSESQSEFKKQHPLLGIGALTSALVAARIHISVELTDRTIEVRDLDVRDLSDLDKGTELILDALLYDSQGYQRPMTYVLSSPLVPHRCPLHVLDRHALYWAEVKASTGMPELFPVDPKAMP